MKTIIDKMNIKSAELFFSGSCNLNCVYCYVPKVEYSKKLNSYIREWISSKTVISDLLSLYGNNLSHLSLWGGEPSINLSLLKDIIPDVLNAFPKLENIYFSTNFTICDDIIEFIKCLSSTGRKISLRIQISLDGYKEITDFNRGKGTTDRILNNLKNFINEINQIDTKNLSIGIHNKATWNISNLEHLNNIDNCYQNILFFENIINGEILSKNNSKMHISMQFVGSPEIPGKYIQENGLLFSKVLNNHMILFETKEFKYTVKILPYQSNIQKLFIDDKILFNIGSLTCSAGQTSVALSTDKRIHVCHRSYSLDEDKIIKEISKINSPNCEMEMANSIAVDLMTDKYVVKNKAELMSMLFRLYYHHHSHFKTSANLALIMELADVGQIDSKYKKYENAYLLSLITSTVSSCFMDNILLTGTTNMSPPSVIKLIGNGALDIILQNISKGKCNG